MNDFERIAAVIRHLDAHHASQPSLGELADAARLSESHFHRLFQRWAGITPKDFVQSLTVEHAKRRLRESASVLDAALDAGLSSPGRLHDLLVSIEAASPGEFKSGGQGLSIEWGFAPSPFGLCSIGWNSRGICHLAFHEESEQMGPPPALRENWPNATLLRTDSGARGQAKVIFNSNQPPTPALKAFVRATPFQLKVWRALVRIPAGCVASYSGIAEAVGDSKAARAVGTACGSNSIAYLIPCHRVIRETGVVQGYRWGTVRKRAMLLRESHNFAATTQ
jgi:AraC family transcriptional regulator, regulatory protein of adaptative response / methylated-DNA-[protein]-cysteine methyltransferase